MKRTADGILFTSTEINMKLGQVAAANNISLHDIDTAGIIAFCAKNPFKTEKRFDAFVVQALRTAPVKTT